MRQKKQPQKQPQKRLWQRSIFWAALLPLVCWAILSGGWLLFVDWGELRSAANGPVDAILVLGGSISRETYVAKLAKDNPQIPILISSGSQDPCIKLIFEREIAPQDRVWLEKCANSTFSNFYFSIPILKQWGASKVKMITSPTHLPRAKWLAQILFAAQNIWVEVEPVREQGIPGNREYWLKTILDVGRGLIWATISQFYSPQCSATTEMTEVNLEDWCQRGFKCEYQGYVQKTGRCSND